MQMVAIKTFNIFPLTLLAKLSILLLLSQERVIESLREQKDREDRVRLEELEQMRKENRELKDKLAALQPQKLSQTQTSNPNPTQNQRPDGEVSVDRFGHE